MNNNFPPKPQMPCSPPPYDRSPDCSCKPPEQKWLPECGADPGFTYPPDPCCAPSQYPICPPPGFGQVPHVPSVIEGSSLYEAMEIQNKRVNECIKQWNAISANCYKYMQECVNAARMNDVYYDDCEVGYEEGYDTTDECTYSIVKKKAVDKNGQPIRVKLALPYDNTTNSGLKQKIFDVSFIKKANVIITAVPTNQTNWKGPAMYQGAPIPGEMPIEDVPATPVEKPEYVYGFDRGGALHWFGNNITYQGLCQKQMVDVIGNCIPALMDNKETPMIQEYTSKGAVTAIGYRCSDGTVFFFQAGNQDQPGMAPVNVAHILKVYGCSVAVITSFIENENLNESNGMLFLGQICQAPTAGKEPDNLAYWYISKGPCFNNTFRETIANLVQTTGRNGWRNYLLGVEVQSFDERITQNHEDILAEVERATQAEKELSDRIQSNSDKIQEETDRAEAAEEALHQEIVAETNRATQAEQNLHQEIVDETQRATQRENEIAADLAAEKLRAQTRENEIQAALDKEIQERIAADNDIINALEQEVLARRAADTYLENKIDAVKNELTEDIDNVTNIINGITGGQTNLPYLKLTGGTLTGPVNFGSSDTITLGRGPTADLEAATKKYVDDAIAAGGGGGGGGDVTKEYVDQQITNVQSQLDGKVNKTGDTMTGDLNMDSHQIQNAVLSSNTGTVLDDGAGGPGKITNMAAPTGDTDGVNKKYLDDQIPVIAEQVKDNLGDAFLPTAGGTMTGDIGMSNSVINFYETEEIWTPGEDGGSTGGGTGPEADSSTPPDPDEGDGSGGSTGGGGANSSSPKSLGYTLDQARKKVMTPSGTPLNIRPSRVAKELGITKELLEQAHKDGIDIVNATVEDIATYASTIQNTLRGSVYNDAADMVVKSETGRVCLKGTEVNLSDGAGNDINITGVDTIAGNDALTLSTSKYVIINSPNTHGVYLPNGMILGTYKRTAETAPYYQFNLIQSNNATALTDTIGSSLMSLICDGIRNDFMNSTTPKDININTYGNLNLGFGVNKTVQSKITNVKPGTDDNDVVTYSQLKTNRFSLPIGVATASQLQTYMCPFMLPKKSDISPMGNITLPTGYQTILYIQGMLTALIGTGSSEFVALASNITPNGDIYTSYNSNANYISVTKDSTGKFLVMNNSNKMLIGTMVLTYTSEGVKNSSGGANSSSPK